MPAYRFPRQFVWGVAAAAPQIEGAAFTDGKGPSIWDTFSRVPGKVHNADTLDVACDHYHRFDDDFALMARLGLKHYRLSIAWPRIFPQGRGAVNQAGLDFYHRLFASMKRHGITPWVTLFHWDLPQALEDEGGWCVRSVVDAFATYADTVVRTFRGVVKNWITLNEISCFTHLAYGVGSKAPGAQVSAAVVNQTYHHALLCHGQAVRAVREHGGRGARVGLTDNPTVSLPVTDTDADIAAARRTFREDNFRVLDAIYRGRYATAYLKSAGAAAPKVARGDFALITLPTDFLGLNLYTGHYVRAGRRGQPDRVPFPAHFPRADSPWLQLAPQTLYWAPRYVSELWNPPALYITENGAGYDDDAPVNGRVDDLHRRECLRNNLREMHAAIQDGVPIKGYFLWSFMDNYEWEDGYARRFGIVYNDFKTQQRIPKLSALWYQQVVRENRLM